MKKQKNQRALSNAGFSLLEVILSMAILAILSIPLMSYFTQSMKYNAKMADKQHASNLAQEIMEDVKAQQNLIQNVTASGFDVPYLTGKNYALTSYTSVAAGGPVIGGSAEYYGQADSIGEDYDIVVKVNTDTAENVEKVPQFDGIDDTKDVVALENGQMQDALNYFSAEYMLYLGDTAASMDAGDLRDYIQCHLKRTISITIEKQYVRVACSYQCVDVTGADGAEVIDSTEVYTCNDFAEENIQNVEHIYLMYYAYRNADNTDHLEICCDAATAVPKLIAVCQNIDEVTAGFSGYKLVISPKDGCPMPEVASNLGKKSYENPPVTNGGGIWQDSYKLSNVEDLVPEESGIRNVNVEVSVYQKNKGNEADRDDYRYITVNSAKGE